MKDRYRVIDGSVSCHCCFACTVVDTKRPVMIGGSPYVDIDGVAQFETMCECFGEDEAIKIAGALNGINNDES